MVKREGLMSDATQAVHQGVGRARGRRGHRPPGAWAAGSDTPEKKEVRIGFIPLTDCASW